MQNDAQIIEQALSLLRDLAARPLGLTSDDEVVTNCREVERLGRLIDAARVQYAGELAWRSRDELGSFGLAYKYGKKKGVALLEHLTLTSALEAGRRIGLARSIRPRQLIDGVALEPEFPAVANGLTAGDVGVEAARSISRILDSAEKNGASPEDVALAEAELVKQAAFTPADLVRTQAEVWRAYLDPDGAEPRDARAFARLSARAGRAVDGLVPITILAPVADAALWKAACDEADVFGSTPRFLSDDDRRAGTTTMTNDAGEAITTFADPRRRPQRHFDILFGNFRAGLRAKETGDTGTRSLATINVLITASDFESGRGVGWIDGVAEPIAASTVKELACSEGVWPIRLGQYGELLDETAGDLVSDGSGVDVDTNRLPRRSRRAAAKRAGRRHKRFFDGHQRQLLVARDGPGCAWPGCTAPTAFTDAHHVLEDSKGGETVVENGILLCRAHHRMLHHSGFTVRMINRTPWLLAPFELDPSQTWLRLGFNPATAVGAVQHFRV